MQRAYEARGLSVVGITSHDTAAQVREFQQELKQDYTVLLSGDDAPEQFKTGPGRPATFILDRAGHIRQRFIGEKDRATFEAAVKQLLDEAPTTASAR